jgi:hypothetical protein
MAQIKLYQWDSSGIYTGAVIQIEETSAMPLRSTLQSPPKLTGTQVARWTGAGWEKLSKAPESDPLPAPDWLALIAARRYQAEIGGIELQGLPIATDDRSKTLINGSALKALRNSAYTLRWKTEEGFIDLPADQVLVMADAVADHVQACFDREAELQAAVADGTITAEMVEQGWPS